MTIAIKVTLKEDWGMNQPCVEVVARPIVRTAARLGYAEKTATDEDRVVARLTPQTPEADVCITRDQDLFFRVEPNTNEKLRQPR